MNQASVGQPGSPDGFRPLKKFSTQCKVRRQRFKIRLSTRREAANNGIEKGYNNMEIQTNDLNTKLSAIDKALAAAKARKAAREDTGVTPKARPSQPKAEKIKVDDAAKAAAKAAKEEARKQRQEQLKQQREARRAAKVAERGEAKTPHMKKIEKAAAALPVMADTTQMSFNELTTNLSAAQITALALHLQHFNRVKATERALKQELEAGQQVRIIGGPTKHVGKIGTVDRAQRIRCFVNIPGVRKPVYLFTSDVETIAEEIQATGTEG
jgi:transcription antitermination factor NusG